MNNKFNKYKTGVKYFVRDTTNKVFCLLEHEFKHFLRHNNLKLGDYNVAGFSTITNGYTVYITKTALNYKGKRSQIKK
jgi:hypothetical protein